MSFIKKLGVFLVFLGICGYVTNLWSTHKHFEETGEKLVRQLGATIIDEIGRINASCKAAAHIDSVAISNDGLFAKNGLATLYISGKNSSAVSIQYRMETSGGKVYVQPQDQNAARLSLMQFGMKGCS